jgi:hypothetical protein
MVRWLRCSERIRYMVERPPFETAFYTSLSLQTNEIDVGEIVHNLYDP